MKFRLRRTTAAPSTLGEAAPTPPLETPVEPRARLIASEGLVGAPQESAGDHLLDPGRGDLVNWARGLATQGSVTSRPLHFMEKPLVPVWVDRVSAYAACQLTTIVSASIHKKTGTWGAWTPEWWTEREDEAFGALEALRQSLEERERES